ncbi:hypothetical protein [Azospirillum sp. TSO5]|uniref:hypothetical protein n=1 Tax=Azospirillum sp. TSO5 TaxID=716760 RepID=UPI0011B25589|nr:hypothetical protein [Azospirillum sp. TSO5]
MAVDEFAGNGAEMQAETPESISAQLRALTDETMCFDGPATYALIGRAADMLDDLAARENEVVKMAWDAGQAQAVEAAREEGRQSAFAAMVEEAAAITLGAATDRPSTYSEFMNAIRRATDGVPPKLRSLSYTEKLLIAGEMLVRDPSGVAMAAAEFKAKEHANG